MGGKLGVAIRCKRGRRGMSFGRGVVSDGWRGDVGAFNYVSMRLFILTRFRALLFGYGGLATSQPRFIFDSVPHGLHGFVSASTMLNKEEEVCNRRSMAGCCHDVWCCGGCSPEKARRWSLSGCCHCCSPSSLLTHSLYTLSLFHHTHQHPPAPCVLKQRKKGFKKSIDVDEGRRRREETTIQIRKTAKDVRLAKRRQMPGATDGGMGGGGGGGYSNMNTPAALAAASMLAAGGVAPGGYGERMIPIFPPPSFFISH